MEFFSEDFLSAANPYLLQGEIAAVLLLGIGIVYESDRYPESAHRSAFWFVVVGVVFETIFSILLFAPEEQISSIQNGALKSAALELAATTKTAAAAIERAAKLEKEAAELRIRAATLERNLGPRHVDGDKFLSILGDDPKGEFEIRYAAGDQETRLFALSLRVLLIKSG